MLLVRLCRVATQGHLCGRSRRNAVRACSAVRVRARTIAEIATPTQPPGQNGFLLGGGRFPNTATLSGEPPRSPVDVTQFRGGIKHNHALSGAESRTFGVESRTFGVAPRWFLNSADSMEKWVATLSPGGSSPLRGPSHPPREAGPVHNSRMLCKTLKTFVFYIKPCEFSKCVREA